MLLYLGDALADSTTATTMSGSHWDTTGSVYAVTASTTANFDTMMRLIQDGNEPEPLEGYIPEPVPTCIIKQARRAERREAERSYLQQIAKAERHRPKNGKFRKVNRRKIGR